MASGHGADALFLFAGLACGCLVLAAVMQGLPRSVSRVAGLMLVLPAIALAFLGVGRGVSYAPLIRGGLLSLPVMFPVGSVLLRRPVDLNRIAAGLGADRAGTLRLVWLPLLLPSLMISVLIAVALGVCCLWLAPL